MKPINSVWTLSMGSLILLTACNSDDGSGNTPSKSQLTDYMWHDGGLK